MRATRPTLLAAITLLTLTASPTLAEDWPHFLGPTGDGKSTESIRLEWPETGPPILWHRAVGEGYSAPSVAEGRLFVFDRVGDQARLAAWDPATGESHWQIGYTTDYEDYYDYSGGPRTSPVIDAGRVVTFGVEGRLRAHRVTDGELLWDVDTTTRYGVIQNFFGVGATPVVEGDLLIVMVGGSPQDSPTIHSGKVQGNGTGLVAFDLATGAERWRTSDELASYATPTLATIDGTRHGLAFLRGGLLGFDPSDGAERFFFPWRAKKLESVNAASPLVIDDTVLITESYGPGAALLRLVEGEGGTLDPKVVWKDPRRGKSLESHWSTPIVHDGFIYASSGQSTGEAELRAIDHATGKVRWRVPGLGRSTLLYADEHLVVLT
ncbi:MAG: PQQ-binding-like beta-propeller repeat protein, partial [Acidobacteriota bacterium]